ncbi:Uncharacterised protein g6901 [Pycnogonum litorale]
MNKELRDAHETIRRLEEQLKELQAAKDNLEAKQNELQALMERLEAAKQMEAEEKQKLEDEIRLKQDEVMLIKQEVDEKDEVTRTLQRQIEEAKVKQQEVAESMLRASQATQETTHLAENDHGENDEEISNGEIGADLSHDENLNIPKHEEDRITQLEKEKHLHDQRKVNFFFKLSNWKSNFK